MQSNILPGSPSSDTDTDEPLHGVRTPRVGDADPCLHSSTSEFSHLNKLQLQAIYRGVHTHGARPAEEHPYFLALSDRYVAIEDDGSFGAAHKLQERAANGQDWSTGVYVNAPNSTCAALPPRLLIRADHPKLTEALQHFTLEPDVDESTRTRVARAFAGVPNEIWNRDLVSKQHPLEQPPVHISGEKRLYVTSVDERSTYSSAPTYKTSSAYEASTQSVPVADAAITAMNANGGTGSSRISGNVLVNKDPSVTMCTRDMLMLSLVHNAFYGKASAAEARWVAENLMFRKGHPEDLRTIGIAFAFPMKYDCASAAMVPDDSLYAHSAHLLPPSGKQCTSVLKFATRNASPNCWPRIGVPVVRLAFLGLDANKAPNYLNGFHGSKKLYPLVHQMMLVVHERIEEMNLKAEYAAFLKVCPLCRNEKEASKVSFMNLRRDIVREIDTLDPRLKATLASGASVPPDWPLEEYREAVATFIARVAALPIGTAWVRTRSPLFPEGIRYKKSGDAAYPNRMVAAGTGDVDVHQVTHMDVQFSQGEFQRERDEVGTNPVASERMELMLEPHAWLPQPKSASEAHRAAFPQVYDSEWEVQLLPLLQKKEEALNGASLLDPNEYFGTPKASVAARYVLWVLKMRFGTHVGPKINVAALPTIDEIGRTECTDPRVLNSIIKKLIHKDDCGPRAVELTKQRELLQACQTHLDEARNGLEVAVEQRSALTKELTNLRRTNETNKRKMEDSEAENKRLKADAAKHSAEMDTMRHTLHSAQAAPPVSQGAPPPPASGSSSSRKLVATPGKDHWIEFAPARLAANPDDAAPDSIQTLRFKAPKGGLMLMVPAPNGHGCRAQDLGRFDSRDISVVFTPASPTETEP